MRLARAVAAPRPSAAGGRLRSLDLFRGIMVGAMMLVNAPGASAPNYQLLEHMSWHGWTPADIIFPSFLFIVGAAVPFACDGRLARGEPRRALVRRAAWRAALLVALGLLGGLNFDAERALRIPGVLQRIGLCYLAAVMGHLYLRGAGLALAAGAVLGGYWLALTLVPVPGHGAGDLSPAGNLASHVDRLLLGPHMGNAVCDPEGLLSTLPAAATALGGALAGRWLRTANPPLDRFLGLLACGACATALGLLWARWLPLNKHIYTSSFALLSCGLGALILALLYDAADRRGRAVWARPFEAFGRHALLAFCASSMALAVLEATGGRAWLRTNVFGWLPPRASTFAWSLSWLLLWLGIVRAYVGARLSWRRG